MPPKRVTLAARAAQQQAAPTPPPAAAPASEGASVWLPELAHQEVIGLPITQIMPNVRQPRTIFAEAALQELADSIRAHGVIQPIIVRPIALTKWDGHARRYEIIAGERRWRASQLAAQTTIPTLIREGDDHAGRIELALIENLHRADLHPLEEAAAFGLMRDELGYGIRRIAERLGRSKGYVENRLKLLDMPDDLQQLVSARPDVLTHVSEVARITDPAVRADLIAAVRAGLSYAETQTRVRALLTLAAEVSLRRDILHAPQLTAEHADSDAQVSLRRDTLHAPQPTAEHADSDAQVSLRRDTHDPQPDADHASLAAEVSLRKDTHDPQPDAEHADSATGVSLRKDTPHAPQPTAEHAGSATEVSLRKDTHVPQPTAEHADSDAEVSLRKDTPHARQTTAEHADSAVLALTSTERAALAGVTAKLAQWRANPALLAAADRALLDELAAHLATLRA